MNRRTFFKAAGLLAAAPLPVLANIQVPTPYHPNDILRPDEIKQHFIYAPNPVFRAHGQIVVVKTYFNKAIMHTNQISEAERLRQASYAIAYIKRWFSFYVHINRGVAKVEGPYVHSVRVGDSFIIGPSLEKYYPVLMRVGYAKHI